MQSEREVSREINEAFFFAAGSDLGGSVRIPANFAGISSLKPTCGRIPIHGQGSDGGLVGVVGLYNTLGFMGRSAAGIEALARDVLNAADKVRNDSRFVPIPWREEVALRGKKKLRIGW